MKEKKEGKRKERGRKKEGKRVIIKVFSEDEISGIYIPVSFC